MKPVNVKSLTELYIFKIAEVNDQIANDVIEAHSAGVIVIGY